MSTTKKQGRGPLDKFDPPKKHYCPEHGHEMKIVAVGFRRRIRFVCPEGCDLGRRGVIKR